MRVEIVKTVEVNDLCPRCGEPATEILSSGAPFAVCRECLDSGAYPEGLYRRLKRIDGKTG